MGEPLVASEKLSTRGIVRENNCKMPMLPFIGSAFRAHLHTRRSTGRSIDSYFKVCAGLFLFAVSFTAWSNDESGYSPEFNPVTCPEENYWFEHHALLCGKVTVPHSYSSASDGTLDIMVYRLRPIRVKAHTPMVYINSEPGESFLKLRSKVDHLSYMMPEREMVFYEFRGMVELQADSPCTAPENQDANQFSGQLDDANSVHAKRIRRHQEFRRDCTIEFLQKNKIPGEAFHIDNLARDVESIRAALKIDQWDVKAHGFGAGVALEVLRLAPENSVRSMVLSAPGLPLAKGNTEAEFEISYATAAALQKLFAACERERMCRKQYPQLQDQFLQTASQLTENPLIVSSRTTGQSEELDAADFIRIAYELLDGGRGTDLLPALTGWIENADNNALAHLLELIVPESASEVSAGKSEILTKSSIENLDSSDIGIPVRVAMECHGQYTVEHILDENVRKSEVFKLLDDYTGRQWIDSSDCDGIVNSRGSTSAQFTAPETNVPVLLLAGGNDPRAPADYAVWLSTQLPTAILLLDPQENHNIDSFDSCIGLEAVHFLEQPATYTANKCTVDSELHLTKHYPEEWVADLSKPWVVGQVPQHWFRPSSELFGASYQGAEHYTNIRAFVNFQQNDQADEKIQDNARSLLLSTSKNPDMPSEHDNVLRRRIGDFTWTLVSYLDEDFGAQSWIAWRRSYSSLIIAAMTTNDSNKNRALKNLFDPFLESLKPCINFEDRISNKLIECQF